MAFATLEKTPLPQDIVGKTAEELVFLPAGRGDRAPQLPKAKLLVDVANQSLGLTKGSQMARFEIATLIRQYRLLEEEIEEVNSHLAELATSTEEYVYLSSVPGIGEVQSHPEHPRARSILRQAKRQNEKPAVARQLVPDPISLPG